MFRERMFARTADSFVAAVLSQGRDQFFVLDVIFENSGDVAHVVVITTLPVLDCLWLEKMLHTHAKRPQPQIPAKGTCLLSLQTYPHETQWPTR